MENAPRIELKMRKIFLILLVTGCVPILAQAQMYHWADENGVAHYGDRVPPKTVSQRREVLNERGQIISVQEREATAAERAQAEAEQRKQQAAAAAAAHQSQYDLSLTATYTTVDQLDASYENRLAIVDGKIKSANKTHADIQKVLEPLNERAASGKAETGMDKRIHQTQTRLHEQERVLERLQADRLEIEKRHQADRERFLTLTSE